MWLYPILAAKDVLQRSVCLLTILLMYSGSRIHPLSIRQERAEGTREHMLVRDAAAAHSRPGREGETQHAGSFQYWAQSRRPGRKKCLQWGLTESQASEVTKGRRHSLGSRGSEQPKKPLSVAGMWGRTPPRRQTTRNLFASLSLISNSSIEPTDFCWVKLCSCFCDPTKHLL